MKLVLRMEVWNRDRRLERLLCYSLFIGGVAMMFYAAILPPVLSAPGNATIIEGGRVITTSNFREPVANPQGFSFFITGIVMAIGGFLPIGYYWLRNIKRELETKRD